MARLKSAGRDIELTEYADGQHGFDTPLGRRSVVAKGSQTVRACTIKEGPAGVLVNTATGAPFALHRRLRAARPACRPQRCRDRRGAGLRSATSCARCSS